MDDFGETTLARRTAIPSLLALALLATGASGMAQAQGFDIRSLFQGPTTTGTANPPPAAQASAGPEWSGEPGASGHPSMTSAAIREAAANFRGCLEGLWPLAARRNVPRAVYDRYVSGLTPDLRIMDLLDAQPEFSKSFWDYLDMLVSEARVVNGRAVLAKHKAEFDAAEKAYGVDRHFVAAIWGVNRTTAPRSVTARWSVRPPRWPASAVAKATSARSSCRRWSLLARGDVTADHLKGSWAGAFGPTQFMPTSYKRFAVDFDGDGRRNVVDSMPDLIASTSNNLKKDGWVPGQTWGYEVVVPKGFNFLLADRSRMMTIRDWEKAGIRRAGDKGFPRPDDRAFLLVPAGAQGPGFLMLQNFRAIMKYNPAEAYAMAIGHLADRLRGGGPFIQPWPRHERVLSRTERYELQQLLARRGFQIGEPDGRLGGRTRTALREFQSSIGHVPDGFASATMLERLRASR